MSKKTLSLNISERVAALQVLNTFKGNLDKLSVILEDIKQLPVLAEEWEKAGRVITPGKDPNSSQWSWDDEKGGLKEVILQEATADYLRDTIKSRNDKGDFGLQDQAFLTLRDKLV